MVQIAIYVIGNIALASLSSRKLIKTEHMKVFVQISSKRCTDICFFFPFLSYSYFSSAFVQAQTMGMMTEYYHYIFTTLVMYLAC